MALEGYIQKLHEKGVIDKTKPFCWQTGKRYKKCNSEYPARFWGPEREVRNLLHMDDFKKNTVRLGDSTNRHIYVGSQRDIPVAIKNIEIEGVEAPVLISACPFFPMYEVKGLFSRKLIDIGSNKANNPNMYLPREYFNFVEQNWDPVFIKKTIEKAKEWVKKEENKKIIRDNFSDRYMEKAFYSRFLVHARGIFGEKKADKLIHYMIDLNNKFCDPWEYTYEIEDDLVYTKYEGRACGEAKPGGGEGVFKKNFFVERQRIYENLGERGIIFYESQNERVTPEVFRKDRFNVVNYKEFSLEKPDQFMNYLVHIDEIGIPFPIGVFSSHPSKDCKGPIVAGLSDDYYDYYHSHYQRSHKHALKGKEGESLGIIPIRDKSKLEDIARTIKGELNFESVKAIHQKRHFGKGRYQLLEF